MQIVYNLMQNFQINISFISQRICISSKFHVHDFSGRSGVYKEAAGGTSVLCNP